MSRYIRIRNTETGEEAIIDTRMSRYRRLAQGFLNSLRFRRCFLKHITITQRVENYRPNILNSFLVKMRRYYGDIIYIWTVESQQRGVLHWHMIVGFDYGINFGRDDVLRIQKYWKYGNVDISPVSSPSLSYLLKYITKSLDVEGLIEGYQIKRIGSSRIAGWLRQSLSSLISCLSFFSLHGLDPDHFYWYRGSAYVFLERRRKLWVYRKPPSGWKFVCAYDDCDPF